MSKFKVVSEINPVNHVHYSWNIYDDSWIAYMVDCIVYPDGPDAREVIIIGGTEEFEIRHRDEDAAYRDNCPMLVGLYPSEGELIATWNYSK